MKKVLLSYLYLQYQNFIILLYGKNNNKDIK